MKKLLLFLVIFMVGCSQSSDNSAPPPAIIPLPEILAPEVVPTIIVPPVEKLIVYTYPYPAYCSSVTISQTGVMGCSQDTTGGKTLALHILGPLECHNGLIKNEKEEFYCMN